MLDFGIIGRGAIGRALQELISAEFSSVDTFGRNSAFLEAKIYFIATKSYDVNNALQELSKSRLEPEIVVVLSNGFVTENFAQQRFPVIRGSVSFGSYLENESVMVSGLKPDSLRIGSRNSELKILCKSILGLTFCKWDESFEKTAQLKWLFNTVINSLCAAYRLPRNGLLLDYEDELSTVFEEAYDLGEDIYGGFDKPRSNLFTQLKDLILATSMNQNSMQRDIEMRRKTEAEYFTGLATGRDGFLNLKKLHGYLI